MQDAGWVPGQEDPARRRATEPVGHPQWARALGQSLGATATEARTPWGPRSAARRTAAEACTPLERAPAHRN